MRPKLKLAKNLLPVDFWRQRFLPITVWPFDRLTSRTLSPHLECRSKNLVSPLCCHLEVKSWVQILGPAKGIFIAKFPSKWSGWLLFLWNFWNLIYKVVICLLIVCTSRCRRRKNIFKKQHWLLLFGKFYDLFLSDSDQRENVFFISCWSNNR